MFLLFSHPFKWLNGFAFSSSYSHKIRKEKSLPKGILSLQRNSEFLSVLRIWLASFFSHFLLLIHGNNLNFFIFKYVVSLKLEQQNIIFLKACQEFVFLP